jgi:pseudouridine synthase
VKERVQKLMAQANVGSRRANEELIRQGRVRVNGKVIKLGDRADPATDVIEVDGARLNLATQHKIYIAFNKPLNVLTTNVRRRDDGRQTVRDFIPIEGHLFTIGRLDADSEGLIVLTNDGELTNKLTHPRYGHTKTYRATVYGLPSEETIAKWERGVHLEEGKTAPCSVRIVKGAHDLTTLEIVMTEGKKHQVRRVASMLGHPVKRLVRTQIGRLGLGGLRPGEWRELDSKEVALMQIRAMQINETKPHRVRRTRTEAPSPPERRGRTDVVKRDRPDASPVRRHRQHPTPRAHQRSAQRGNRRKRSE